MRPRSIPRRIRSLSAPSFVEQAQPLSEKSHTGTPVVLDDALQRGSSPIVIRQVQSWPSYIVPHGDHFRPSLFPTNEISTEDSQREQRFATRAVVRDYGRLLLGRETGGMFYASDVDECTRMQLLSCNSAQRWNPYWRNLAYHKMDLFHTMNYGFGTGACFNISYSPNGSILLASYENGFIDILHSATERLTRIRFAHADGVNAFSWLDEQRFISCSDDCCIATWDVRLCNKPMQVLHINDLTPTSLIGEHSLDGDQPWIKDMHLIPKHSNGNGQRTLLVTAFSKFIYRVSLDDSDLMTPLALSSVSEPILRSAYLPENSRYDGNLLIASVRPSTMTTCFVKPALRAKEQRYLPAWSSINSTKILEDGNRPLVPASYRSMKVDPLGGGILVRKNRLCRCRDEYSYTAYYKLESNPRCSPEIPDNAVNKFFIRDKVSEDYFQEPAFSPNGCFVACPQVAKISILTSGPAAVPFSYSPMGRNASQFHVAALVDLPNCSDVLCCDVSPADNITVASGCSMGHVHFVQPRF
ncbi:DDB1- and CUL4-associated factor 10-like [Paramacrobiotus metropolitanus]|uniref:DDB1- and CUL4-associated factor 10-like n=1 Tax=Paramacrobiotus metropolitanus TaxID=2943436 RepID=UPI002445ADF3|nr:DDB1- and CUL4-associated factor 10-like [Paramacrobiotus metropolitanus]